LQSTEWKKKVWREKKCNEKKEMKFQLATKRNWEHVKMVFNGKFSEIYLSHLITQPLYAYGWEENYTKVNKVKGKQKLWALKFDFTLALVWPTQRAAEWVYEKLLLS
jgi:hypothetical protein